MTSKKATDESSFATQSDEVRERILANSTAGGDTAIGNARAAADKEIPEGEDRGSKAEIVGGEPQADYPAFSPAAPVGSQSQPALITTNGTLPVGHVASPSGLVPVSAVTSDPTHATQLIQDHLDEQEKQILRSGYEKLSRAKIESMSAGELRAVASDRGYDIGDYAGSRSTRQRFIKAQNEDEGLKDSEAVATDTES